MSTSSEPLKPAEANGAPQPQLITTAAAQVTYANFCRGTLTPDEVVLDFGFNSNGFGVKVLEEDIEIKNRIIFTPVAAKRLLFLLNDVIRRHEANFGEVEIDFRKRVKAPQGEGGR